MRIALFHNVPSGGAKRCIYESTRRLVADHSIDVFTLSSANHAFGDIRPFVRNHFVFDFAPRRLFSSPWGRLNQLQRWRDLSDLKRIGRRIAYQIDLENYDVVFAHTCQYTFIPAFLRFVQTPAIFYFHEPFGRGFVRDFRRPYVKSTKWRKIGDRLDPLIKLYNHRLESMQSNSINHIRRGLVNSHFTKEQVRLAFGLDVPVCYCGVDVESFRPISTISKENFVISVGELSPRKGFDFIVESIGRIPTQDRPQLVLACNSIDISEKLFVETLATQRGVRLQILSELDKDELAIQYNRARFCVYAPVLEPFGLVPLEAMSCGTPVIGVREGGVLESIVHEHTGLLVERNPDQFAQAIHSLWSNPLLAAAYGRAGRAHVLDNWTWDQSVASLDQHLSECADNHRKKSQWR